MNQKIKTILYLLCIAVITIASFVIAPLSFTSVFMAVALVVNILLFADNLRQK